MIHLIIHRLATEVLEDLARYERKNYKRIKQALDDLKEKGLETSNCKSISGGYKLFRKRVGRYRILFTVDREEFHIWIIDMKKSPQDYVRWMLYIHSQQRKN